MNKRRRTLLLAWTSGLATSLVFIACGANADTLGDAVALAYQTNPVLLAARADLRQLDEEYVQARGAMGPTAQVSVDHIADDAKVTQSSIFGGNSTTHSRTTTDTTQLSISQPLYSSGALSMRLSQANADVLGGRETLRQQEASVLNDVIGAYLDVLLAQDMVAIAEQNVDILQAQLREIEAKFRVKEVTQTDGAQTRARLVAGQSSLAAARNRLTVARSKYFSVVGQMPGQLEPPPNLTTLPDSVDTAFNVAEYNNPELWAAMYREQASRAAIAQERAASGVQVGLSLNMSRGALAPYLDKTDNRSVSSVVTVRKPLFSSGQYASRVRAAIEGNTRDQMLIADARRRVDFAVAQAWSNVSTSRQLIDSLHAQLIEEEKAFKGAKIEEVNGLRSTIDVLNAEQEFQNTKEALAQQYHDEYVARVSLLLATGLLQADVIDPTVSTYRPEQSFNRVKSKTPPWTDVVQAIDSLGARRADAPRPVKEQLPADYAVADRHPMPEAPDWINLTKSLTPIQRQ